MPACHTTELDRLMASTLTLMSAYARNAEAGDAGCARLAFSIEQHLQCIANHAQTPVLLRATCEELLDDWYAQGGRHLAALRQDDRPARRRPGGAARLLRLVTGQPPV